MPRNCSAAWLAKRKRSCRVEQHDRHRQRAEHRARRRSRAASRPARGRPPSARGAVTGLLMPPPPARPVCRNRRFVPPRDAAWRSAGRRTSSISDCTAAGIRQPHHAGAELGRARQAARVPGDMLAREPQPGIGAEMRQHRLVMLEQDGFLLGQRRVRQPLAGAQEPRAPGRGTRAGRSSRARSSRHRRPSGAAPRPRRPRSGCRRWRSPGCAPPASPGR